MKKKNMLIAAAIGALTLAPLAPAALAEHTDEKIRRGGVAQRSHNLDELAYRLLDATRDLKHEVRRAAHQRPGHRGPWGVANGYRDGVSGQTLRLAQELEAESARFLNAVERRSLHQIERRFDRMAATFEDVACDLDRVRSKRIRQDLNRVAELMDRVDRNVALAAGYGRGYGYGDRDGRADVELRRDRPVRTSGQVVLGNANGKGRFQVRIGW